MSHAKELYIIRHGQTDYNLKGIVQGRGVDAPLNETGRKQAGAFYEKYGSINFDILYTSTLIRTKQTVKQIIEGGIRYEERPHIDEISWGIYEGLRSSPDMKLDYFKIVNSWIEGDLNHRTEGGESPLDVQERLVPFIDELKSEDFSKALICTHGRTMRIMLCTMLGKDLSQMDQFDHANLTLYKLSYDGENFKMLLKNCTEHLEIFDC
ncbi:MAG: histidine phosphatase family protein [Chitinophagales bacterium]|nr:histidine phosphatase family protein [Chitinophagales bacterium]